MALSEQDWPHGLGGNPPDGEKGYFPEMTTTLNLEVYRPFADEMKRCELGKEPNAQPSAIFRKAAADLEGNAK